MADDTSFAPSCTACTLGAASARPSTARRPWPENYGLKLCHGAPFCTVSVRFGGAAAGSQSRSRRGASGMAVLAELGRMGYHGILRRDSAHAAASRGGQQHDVGGECAGPVTWRRRRDEVSASSMRNQKRVLSPLATSCNRAAARKTAPAPAPHKRSHRRPHRALSTRPPHTGAAPS